MSKTAKEMEMHYLSIYVTCRLQWVAELLKQIKDFQDGDEGLRGEQAFVQRCDFGTQGVGVRVDADLMIVLEGRVELWVTKSGTSDPAAGVVVGGEADGVLKVPGDTNGSGKRAHPNGDQKDVCAAIYPTVGQEVTSFLAVLCDEERIPTEHVVSVRCASETPNSLPAELLKADGRIFIPLGGRRDFGLEIRLAWKR